MHLGVDGTSVNDIHCSVPCSAWMTSLVPDADTTCALEYVVSTQKWHIAGLDLQIDVGTLVPNSTTGGLTPVKTLMDGNHYAILQRGLLCLGMTWLALHHFEILKCISFSSVDQVDHSSILHSLIFGWLFVTQFLHGSEKTIKRLPNHQTTEPLNHHHEKNNSNKSYKQINITAAKSKVSKVIPKSIAITIRSGLARSSRPSVVGRHVTMPSLSRQILTIVMLVQIARHVVLWDVWRQGWMPKHWQTCPVHWCWRLPRRQGIWWNDGQLI